MEKKKKDESVKIASSNPLEADEKERINEITAPPPSVSKSYTFQLSTPLGAEITSGQQTFVEIDGILYLKISNHEEVPPDWYTSLKKDFETAKTPLTKAQLRNIKIREKKIFRTKTRKIQQRFARFRSGSSGIFDGSYFRKKRKKKENQETRKTQERCIGIYGNRRE